MKNQEVSISRARDLQQEGRMVKDPRNGIKFFRASYIIHWRPDGVVDPRKEKALATSV